MNRTDLQAIAELRAQEAKALLTAGLRDGAYYLLGYAVECALKSCIAKQILEHDFPDKRLIVDSHTHDLTRLLNLAGLKPKLDEATVTRPGLEVNWTVAKDWSEASRYQRGVPEKTVLDLFSAVLDEPDGVLPWLKTWW